MQNKMLCRTCESTNNLTSIYNNEEMEIPFKLMACASIQILESDDLPKMICFQCITTLDNAYQFKLQCETIDYKFRQDIALNEDISYTILEHIKIDIDETSNVESNEYETFCHNSDMITTFKTEAQTFCAELDHCYTKDVSNCNLQIGNYNFTTNMKKKITSNKLYSCLVCEQTFEKYAELIKHKKTHGKQLYFCDVCGRSCQSKGKLQAHLITHMNINQCPAYECKICFKKYTSQGNLNKHMLTHTNTKRHVCNICGKRFIQSNTLKSHMLIHWKEKRYKCTDCGISYYEKTRLLKHKEVIHKLQTEKSISCKFCSSKFVSQRKLHWHVRNQHENSEASNVDGKSFKQSKTVGVCNYCGKAFKSIAYLNTHILLHSGVRPHECSLCSKTFTQKSSLVFHMNKHNEVRPYVCAICSKSFIQPSHLRNHTLTHTGMKPHICSFCNKRFTLKQSLVTHVRNHTGERPYICAVCDEGFIDSKALKKHTTKHVL